MFGLFRLTGLFLQEGEMPFLLNLLNSEAGD